MPFLWDYKSRSISHPGIISLSFTTRRRASRKRPFDEALYAEWQRSGKPSHEFLADIPAFRDQNLKRKPAKELIKKGRGLLPLDCRLNFSPVRRLAGPHRAWRIGFLRHLFSGLWKLTTAAAIPYYTGRYGHSRQGFGFVTIGANVDEFP